MELECCPFCGGCVDLSEEEVVCRSCGVKVTAETNNNEKMADKWNRRVLPEDIIETIGFYAKGRHFFAAPHQKVILDDGRKAKGVLKTIEETYKI